MTDPKLIQIEKVQLINLEDEENKEIERINYKGIDLLSTSEVRSHTEDGEYIIKGLTAKVQYKNELMKIAVSTSSTMSYAKVEDAGNRQKAEELIEIIRDRYLKFFRA